MKIVVDIESVICYLVRVTGTIYKEIELLVGLWIEVAADFEASWVDNGIGGYEFWGARGVHHDWCWEVDNVEPLTLNCDLLSECREHVKTRFPRLRWLWTPLALLLNWQAQRAFAKLDSNEVFTDDELTDAACEQGGDGRDYPDPDYGRD